MKLSYNITLDIKEDILLKRALIREYERIIELEKLYNTLNKDSTRLKNELKTLESIIIKLHT